ncbi:MAG: Holliday junction branch migration DNA helicase RuvB [bacterium JZ-2024 1]
MSEKHPRFPTGGSAGRGALDPRPQTDDPAPERPQSLDEFVGQARAIRVLRIAMQSAKKRNKPIDHTLLSGPPGLGKTTLAHLLAREQSGNLHRATGPALTRPADLASILSTIEAGDVFFVDEVHRLPPNVTEMLLPVMEGFQMHIVIGKGMGARLMRLPVAPFTFVAATTRPGLLPAPFRDRFGITVRLSYYSEDEIQEILKRYIGRTRQRVSPEAIARIASASRGTPRIALRLLRRTVDFAIASGKKKLEEETVLQGLRHLGVDDWGLDVLDRQYLTLVAEEFSGGPVGVTPLAALLGEDRTTVEEILEPFLVQTGYIRRTPRGRVITPLGLKTLQESAKLNWL